MLWGRAASRSSICRKDLVADAGLVEGEALIGEECHIVAQKPGGPRAGSGIPGRPPRQLYQLDPPVLQPSQGNRRSPPGAFRGETGRHKTRARALGQSQARSRWWSISRLQQRYSPIPIPGAPDALYEEVCGSAPAWRLFDSHQFCDFWSLLSRSADCSAFSRLRAKGFDGLPLCRHTDVE